jgi:hypothetical protein
VIHNGYMGPDRLENFSEMVGTLRERMLAELIGSQSGGLLRLDGTRRKRDSAEKPSVHPSRTWMNGGAGEVIGDFPFMLSPVEAFIRFFSRINREPRPDTPAEVVTSAVPGMVARMGS